MVSDDFEFDQTDFSYSRNSFCRLFHGLYYDFSCGSCGSTGFGMDIKYVKGNLFHAPLNSVLVHSCNCKGKWGAGIAVQFKKRFPQTYSAYASLCHNYGKTLLGTCLLSEENGFKVACLFTSSGYGDELDDEISILSNTLKSLADLEEQLPGYPHKYPQNICMPKINSGLFNIPWEKTERVVKTMANNITVYEQD